VVEGGIQPGKGILVFQRLSASLAVLLLSLFSVSPSAALGFSNLYVLGDSLVDAGNTQALVLLLTGGTTDVTPAGAGYYQGRFTNGINPADVLNLAVEGTNTVRSGSGGDNFAYGGARARTDGDLVPDLTVQTTSLLSAHPALDPSALYMINIGGNDVRDIVLGGLSGAARQAVIDAAALAVQTSVTSLQAAGAVNILFVGVGDVGSIPEILALGGTASTDGRQASIDVNAAIQAALPAGAQYFDTIALTDAIALDPTLFGLPAGINTTVACLTSGTPDPAGPPTCIDYAFFDNVHPTTAVLQVLGNELVAAVPEPGTATLLVFGLVALGARRRGARGGEGGIRTLGTVARTQV
jgi:outer membrane lipase/esterase